MTLLEAVTTLSEMPHAVGIRVEREADPIQGPVQWDVTLSADWATVTRRAEDLAVAVSGAVEGLKAATRS